MFVIRAESNLVADSFPLEAKRTEREPVRKVVNC
jgi:hypothetical protein